MRVLVLLAVLGGCGIYTGGGDPDAAPDAPTGRCADFCAWQNSVTGASVPACIADCEATDCAVCCSSTPQWPGCEGDACAAVCDGDYDRPECVICCSSTPTRPPWPSCNP